MRIKGGFGPIIKLRKRFKILHRLLDGKILSSIGFGLLCLFFFPWWQAILCGFCWLGAIAPSIGEEIGAVGGIRGNWPSDPNSWFGSRIFKKLWRWPRVWGWSSGILRGVFSGFLLFIGTGIPWFLLTGSMFPLAYFLGVSIEQIRTGEKTPDWHLGEWIYGGILGLSFMGV